MTLDGPDAAYLHACMQTMCAPPPPGSEKVPFLSAANIGMLLYSWGKIVRVSTGALTCTSLGL